MPEVCGDAALYVDSTNVEQIGSSMLLLLHSKDLRADLANKGLEQASKFIWKKATVELMEVLGI